MTYQPKKTFHNTLLTLFLIVGFQPISLAVGFDCTKAINAAKKAYASDNQYDKFLAVEALDMADHQLDTDFLLQAIDPQTPFLTRSAISTIAALNKASMTEQLISKAAADDEISDLLIDTLQHEGMVGAENFISRYLLEHPNKFDQIKVMKAIAKANNSSLADELKKNYKTYNKDKLVQAYALYAIVKLRNEFQGAKDEALVFANDADPLVREMAVIVLGELMIKESAIRLKTLINDNEPRVGIAALASFLKVTNGGKKEELISILKSKNISGGEIAAGSLKRLPAPLAMDIIKNSLVENTNTRVFLRVMESIAVLKGGEAIEFLRLGLAHQNEDIVVQTLFAIGSRSLLSERELLTPFLESENAAFRSIASWAYLKHPC